MTKNNLFVRELTEADINLIINYWLSADSTFLTGMGVDLSRMPARDEWIAMLSAQLSQSRFFSVGVPNKSSTPLLCLGSCPQKK